MALFAYKAINTNGAFRAGIVEADDLEEAQKSLASGKLSILSIGHANRLVQFLRAGVFSGNIKRRDVIEFARNTSMVLKAGIPILDALEDMGQTTDKKALKDAILDIRGRITSGSTLSDALSANSRVFPDILIRIARIGEETGRLELSLMDVANHLQRLEDLAQAVKQALMYPVFVLMATGSALLFWIVYVMPKLFSIIKEMGVKLPIVTRMLLAVSAFAQSNWYLFPFLLIATIILIKVAKRKEVTRYYFDLILMKLPIVKLFIHSKLLAFFSEQMRIMVIAGLTIDRCFSVVSTSIGSEVFKRALGGIREKLLTGSHISDALKEYKIFPPMVIRMFHIGESSGNLDEQLAFLSDYYFKKLDSLSAKLSKMIEPVLMGIVGIVFLIMTIAMLLPIYDVVSKFK
jgi:type II secretory pathway component PulF